MGRRYPLAGWKKPLAKVKRRTSRSDKKDTPKVDSCTNMKATEQKILRRTASLLSSHERERRGKIYFWIRTRVRCQHADVKYRFFLSFSFDPTKNPHLDPPPKQSEFNAVRLSVHLSRIIALSSVVPHGRRRVDCCGWVSVSEDQQHLLRRSHFPPAHTNKPAERGIRQTASPQDLRGGNIGGLFVDSRTPFAIRCDDNSSSVSSISRNVKGAFPPSLGIQQGTRGVEQRWRRNKISILLPSISFTARLPFSLFTANSEPRNSNPLRNSKERFYGPKQICISRYHYCSSKNFFFAFLQ